jgi:biotin operon repressor
VDDGGIERFIGCKHRISIDDIVSHQRFADARKVHLERFLAVYSGDPFLVRLLLESGRFLVYLIAVMLKAAEEPHRPETWLTVGLLKEKMALFGLASGRHIDDLIARLCAVGYMEMQPSAQDRRVRILQPGEKLHAHNREWLEAYTAPLALLYPEHDYNSNMPREPGFYALYLRTSVSVLPLSAQILASMPDVMLFFNRAAGPAVISALLHAAVTGGEGPHAALPYQDVGDRFGVSRTHVRKLLTTAEEAGLVRLHSRGGHRVELLPRLWQSQDRGLAAGMYTHDLVHVATMRAIAAAAY